MAFQFSEKEIKEMREMFKSFDVDRSGKITQAKLKCIFQELNVNVNDEDLSNMWFHLDKSGKGEIMFEVFIKALEKIFMPLSDNDLKLAFAAIDKDGDKTLTADEIKGVIERFGQPISKTDLDELINSLDKNKDGKVCYEEFVQLFKK